MKKIITLCVGALLVFSLCACDDIGDLPHPSDEEDPTTEIEPGPVEEPEHTHEYGDWQHDDTYHWKECECGEVIDKEEHTLEYKNDETTGEHYQECSICGYQTSLESHNWDNGEVIKEPTCTDTGETLYTCEDCGATETKTIEALGHSWSNEWTHDDTNHWHVCTVCGDVEPDSTVAHTYGNEYYSDAENGHYQVCEICNYHTSDEEHNLSYESVDDTYHHQVCSECTYTTESEAHSYSISGQNDANTHYIKCSVCEHVTTEAHTFTAVVTSPTCTEGGYTTYTCACGYSYTGDDTTALGHTWSSWTSNGTTSENDTHSRTCSTCGETETSPHVWTETARDGATCTTDGEITYTCSTCNVTKTETIPATGHDYDTSTWDGYDNTYHYHVCKTCGAYDEGTKEAHSLEYVSDDSAGHYQKCTECGYKTSDENHSLSYVSDNDTYHHEECSVCDYQTERKEHNYEIVKDSYTADNHTVKCTDCGHETTQEHTFTEVVTNPTCTEGGYTTYTCECGYSYEGDQTDALGHDWGSWTDNGDDDTHIRTCSRCNDTETEKHDYELTDVHDITIYNLATGDITATYEYTCSVCNHKMEAEGPYTLDFATDSWDIIDEVSTSGYASTYYNIGDTKTITINGGSHDIRIIDFDHDELTTSNSSYNNGTNKAGITCEMVDCLGTHSMNSSATTDGGWYSCGMRSYLNSDDGCVLSTLEEDLQSVIKKVDKKSTAGNSSTSLGTTSSDSLFILARVELEGTDSDGYVDEGTQYAYYEVHNSVSDKIKYLNGSAHDWWYRSPSISDSTCFLFISSTGSRKTGTASNTGGFSFAFCV